MFIAEIRSSKSLAYTHLRELDEWVDWKLCGKKWVSWDPAKHPKSSGQRFLAPLDSPYNKDYASLSEEETLRMPRKEGNPMTSYHSPFFSSDRSLAVGLLDRFEDWDIFKRGEGYKVVVYSDGDDGTEVTSPSLEVSACIAALLATGAGIPSYWTTRLK